MEGFQLNEPDVISNNFWGILNAKNTPAVAAQISKVRNPAENDPIPVKFPQYLSMYALAKYDYNTQEARNALLQKYDTLQSEMSTNLYDQGSVAAWTANPKAQTCAELNKLLNSFTQKLETLRNSVQDLSGTAMFAGSMRDENMEYQIKYKAACTNPTSAACISLASQEGPVFPLLAKYNAVNDSLFSNEYDLSNNIQMLQETYSLVQCTDPNPSATFQVESTSGYIDTPALLTKLQNFSPYYLSPDTLKYITGSIISGGDVQDSVIKTSDLYINIANTLNNIKALTNA